MSEQQIISLGAVVAGIRSVLKGTGDAAIEIRAEEGPEQLAVVVRGEAHGIRQFPSTMLDHIGVPIEIRGPDEPAEPSPAEAEAIAEEVAELFGGDEVEIEACGTCGGILAHEIGCPEMDVAR